MREERSQSRRTAPAPAGPISLFSALPDIASAIPPEDRALAERVLVAPLLSACDEDLAGVLSNAPPGVFDVVVVDGVVLKDTTFATRSALELLGPGDILAPPLTAARQLESPAVSRYLAHGPVSLALTALGSTGALVRLDEGGWRLAAAAMAS